MIDVQGDKERARQDILRQVLQHVEEQQPLLVLKAPPGSGKTYIVVRAIVIAWHSRLRVAVATRTNAQADELCLRMAQEFPRVPVFRWASEDLAPQPFGGQVTWETDSKRIAAHGPCIVVATSSKWATSKSPGTFDVMLLDEAWQIAWAEFLPLGTVAARFVLVGDPGQIAPIVDVDVSRWETARRPPHRAAPEVILADARLRPRTLALPVTTRLPHDTAELLQGFYDFHFTSWALPGERALNLRRAGRPDALDGVLDGLSVCSAALHTLPTPVHGPPLEDDHEVAGAAVEVVRRLLGRGAEAVLDGQMVKLRPEDIGITATHRTMNARIEVELGSLSSAVRVDTPERWQGLERLVMVAVHPLSGVLRPSVFDLDTGRLCVMASRHRAGLVVVSRDHVGGTLANMSPAAEQAVGCPDEAGRGHARNLHAWTWLQQHTLAA
jgi:hypothetical protein